MQARSLVFALMGAGLTAAQSLPFTLSSSCSATVQGFLASPDTACLNLGSLLTYFITPDNSVPQTANIWLTGLCGIGTCSNDNIANIITNLTQGCAEDFSNINVDIASLQDEITTSVQQAYPTIRQVACFKDTTTNELCVTQALNNVENVFGELVIDSSLTFDTLSQDIHTFLGSNITEIACTSCAKAAYNFGITDFPDEVSQADKTLQSACGASFLDRSATANVVGTALAKRFSIELVSRNSGLSLKPFTLAGNGLLAFLGASAFLA